MVMTNLEKVREIHSSFTAADIGGSWSDEQIVMHVALGQLLNVAESIIRFGQFSSKFIAPGSLASIFIEGLEKQIYEVKCT